jgi:hypothetical protein
MADNVTGEQTADPNLLNQPLPSVNDPGGAHAKGYSAESGPAPPVKDKDPVPLAPGPDQPAAVRQPERDRDIHPTGRSEPRDYTPNDRLIGADR